ncbi:MAG: DUF1684 domain-containing protein [Lysobacterales bacterium]
MSIKGKREPFFKLSRWLFVLVVFGGLFITATMADETRDLSNQTENHRQSVEAWRESRDERLRKPNGWLTLTGLEWLKEGENRIGRAADNDIQLSGGPEHWGSVVLQNDQVYFKNADLENVKINNEALSQATLIPDTEGEPTTITSGTLNITLIYRESYALRIKDSQATTLKNFKGVDNYPIDESWRIDGRFIPAEEGATMEITNVLGQVSESPVLGTFEFDQGGKTYSLLGLNEDDSGRLWFIFADRTTGHGTYGAGRYLYSEGAPENGHLTVDFNKAYNPPCAFNAYSTCPIPPQRNRMDLQVLAGEKEFHPDSG